MNEEVSRDMTGGAQADGKNPGVACTDGMMHI